LQLSRLDKTIAIAIRPDVVIADVSGEEGWIEVFHQSITQIAVPNREAGPIAVALPERSQRRHRDKKIAFPFMNDETLASQHRLVLLAIVVEDLCPGLAEAAPFRAKGWFMSIRRSMIERGVHVFAEKSSLNRVPMPFASVGSFRSMIDPGPP